MSNKFLNRTNSHFSSSSTIDEYASSKSKVNNLSILPIQDEDDVDTALSKLEKSLDVDLSSNGNNKHDLQTSEENGHDLSNCDIIKHDSTIELCEELFLMKNQKLYTLRKFKSYYFILNDQ